MFRLLVCFISCVFFFPFFSYATPNSEPASSDGLLQNTVFLTPQEWAAAPLKEDVEFKMKGKTLPGQLCLSNDRDFLYLLLIIRGDDFFLGKDGDDWADDRLWVVLDKKGGALGPETSDMLSLSVRDFAIKGTNYAPVCAAQGDWYYEDTKKGWEYSKELDWEVKTVPDQRFSGGKDMKEVYFFHTGELKNGEKQDFAFEIKMPIRARDPYDLHLTKEDVLYLGVVYGNMRDGYAPFPQGSSPQRSTSGFLRYKLQK